MMQTTKPLIKHALITVIKDYCQQHKTLRMKCDEF